MPLKSGSDKSTISFNIKELIHSGKQKGHIGTGVTVGTGVGLGVGVGVALPPNAPLIKSIMFQFMPSS